MGEILRKFYKNSFSSQPKEIDGKIKISQSCWDISGSPSRLDTKKLSKTQIFKLSKMIIKCIKIIFKIQRSLLKSFLVFWGPISAKISFWKKTSQNLPNFTPKWQKSRIFQISIVVWGRKMADIRPKNLSKVPAYPKFLPKFFLSPKLKNWWKIPKQLPPPPKKSRLLGRVELFLWQRDRSVSTWNRLEVIKNKKKVKIKNYA